MRMIFRFAPRRFSSVSLYFPLRTTRHGSRYLHAVQLQSPDLLYAKDFQSLVKKLSRNPKDTKSLAALDSMLTRAPLLDASTAVVVLRGLSLCRKLTRAKALLSDLEQKRTIPELFLFTVVLQCLLPDGPIRDVESVWREISSSYPTVSVSDLIAQLCRRSEGAPEIEQIYQKVSSSRYNLSREAYIDLIRAMCGNTNPNPSLARAVLREMDEKGFEVDSSTYFIVFRSFCRVGNVFDADLILRGLAAKGDNGLDSSIYENFFYGLCTSGKLKEARKLFDKMAKRGFTAGEDSVPNLKMRRRTIFQFTPSSRVSESMSYGSYFRALCRADELAEAERLLEEVKQKNIVLETGVYAPYVQALFQAERVDDAMKFFEIERTQGCVLDGDIVAAATMGLCQIGRVDEAYRRVLEIASLDGSHPTTQAWNCILEGYMAGGRSDEAMRIFEAIKVGGSGGFSKSDASTYAVMVRGILRKGDLSLALVILGEMLHQGMPVGVDLCTGILQALCATGKLEEAHKHLNCMIENGVLVSYAGWQSLFDSAIMQYV